MKKITPYIFPVLVILVVIFLITRWYGKRGQISEYGEGIQIENLSEEELQDALSGVGDYTTVPLEQYQSDVPKPTGTVQTPSTGSIRYEVDEDKVKLSVIVQTNDSIDNYYVWLKTEGSEKATQAFVLSQGKGGLVGSGAFSADQLPVEVLVGKGSGLRDDMSNVVLRGKIAK